MSKITISKTINNENTEVGISMSSFLKIVLLINLSSSSLTHTIAVAF